MLSRQKRQNRPGLSCLALSIGWGTRQLGCMICPWSEERRQQCANERLSVTKKEPQPANIPARLLNGCKIAHLHLVGAKAESKLADKSRSLDGCRHTKPRDSCPTRQGAQSHALPLLIIRKDRTRLLARKAAGWLPCPRRIAEEHVLSLSQHIAMEPADTRSDA